MNYLTKYYTISLLIVLLWLLFLVSIAGTPFFLSALGGVSGWQIGTWSAKLAEYILTKN